MIDTLGLVLVFLVKHYIADFCLQTRWMSSNKYKYFHPGGWVHAGIQGLSTLLIFLALGMTAKELFIIPLLETIFHHTLDCTKMNFGRKRGYNINMIQFWALIGFDQLLHQISYLAIIWWVMSNNLL